MADPKAAGLRWLALSNAKTLEAELPLSPPPFVDAETAFSQLRYLETFVLDLGCKSAVIEQHYIDKDYMEDHGAFYSKSLKTFANSCKRVHFFAQPLEVVRGAFSDALSTADRSRSQVIRCDSLNKAYLGFAVIKPLQGSPVGRTVLAHTGHKKDSPGLKREFRGLRHHTAHVLGVELKVCGLPFQQQDIGVSACATVAVWSSLFQARAREEISYATPAQITSLASQFSLRFGRAMPSDGLSLDQMCQAIQALGAAPDLVPVKDDVDLARGLIYGSAMSGFAPILILERLNGSGAAHAVAVAGIRRRMPGAPLLLRATPAPGTADVDTPADPTEAVAPLDLEIHDRAGTLETVYLHDDRLGPYLKATLSESEALRSQISWSTRDRDAPLAEHDEQWIITHVLLPLHPKIRLSFVGIRYILVSAVRDVLTSLIELDDVALQKPGVAQGFVVDTRIKQSHQYIASVLKRWPGRLAVDDLEGRLCHWPMPRYVGVVRVSHLDPSLGLEVDILVDTTCTRRNAHVVGTVSYGPKESISGNVGMLLGVNYDCPVSYFPASASPRPTPDSPPRAPNGATSVEIPRRQSIPDAPIQ